VKEIISLNRKGIKVDALEERQTEKPVQSMDFQNVVGQDSLTRFDKSKNKRKKNKFRSKENGQNTNTQAPNSDKQ
jgi:hypothetical protein